MSRTHRMSRRKHRVNGLVGKTMEVLRRPFVDSVHQPLATRGTHVKLLPAADNLSQLLAEMHSLEGTLVEGMAPFLGCPRTYMDFITLMLTRGLNELQGHVNRSSWYKSASRLSYIDAACGAEDSGLQSIRVMITLFAGGTVSRRTPRGGRKEGRA